jgi:hypothetical protein
MKFYSKGKDFSQIEIPYLSDQAPLVCMNLKRQKLILRRFPRENSPCTRAARELILVREANLILVRILIKCLVTKHLTTSCITSSLTLRLIVWYATRHEL